MSPSQNLQSALIVAETMLEADSNAISWTAYRGALDNLFRSLKEVMAAENEPLAELRDWLITQQHDAALMAIDGEDDAMAKFMANSSLAVTVAILHQNLRNAQAPADNPPRICRTSSNILNQAFGGDDRIEEAAVEPASVMPPLYGPADPALIDTVYRIIALHLDLDEEKIKETDEFYGTLGADSLDTLELVMAFEEEFGIEIRDDDAEKVVTVADAIQFLSGMVK